jgi:hypothetical protein
VKALGQWAFDHIPKIQGAREKFDVRNGKN